MMKRDPRRHRSLQHKIKTSRSRRKVPHHLHAALPRVVVAPRHKLDQQQTHVLAALATLAEHEHAVAVLDTLERERDDRVRRGVFQLLQLARWDARRESVVVGVDGVVDDVVFLQWDRTVRALVRLGAEPRGKNAHVGERRGHAHDLDVLVGETEDLCGEELEDGSAMGVAEHV